MSDPCEGHKCDACTRCRRGRCCRNDNPSYQLPKTGDWDQAMYGELGVLNDDGDRVECHVCGAWWQFLSKHVWYSHNLTPHEYRALFGLKYRQPLAGQSLRDSRRETGRRNAGSAEWMRSIRPTPEQISAIASRPERLQNRMTRLPKRREMAKSIPQYEHKHHRIRIPCAQCRETFEVYPSQLRRGAYLCSIVCRASWTKAHYRPPTNAKLSFEVASAIRAEYATGQISQRQIAERYGIEQTNVSLIVRGVTWTKPA